MQSSRTHWIRVALITAYGILVFWLAAKTEENSEKNLVPELLVNDDQAFRS
jgi:hypothetical protein